MSQAHGLVDFAATRCTVDPRTNARHRLTGALAAWRSGLTELATAEGKGIGAKGGSHRSVGGWWGGLVWPGDQIEAGRTVVVNGRGRGAFYRTGGVER
jgi:hypothetical protein